MRIKIIYSKKYDINPFGLVNYFQFLHPFDLAKYSKAWKKLRELFPELANQAYLSPDRPVENHELDLVHSKEYLKRIENASSRSSYIAEILEVPFLAMIPGFIVDACILKPMRLAVMGTYIAAKEALAEKIVINLAGGYHHARHETGEGFCVYSDIGYAICKLRAEGLITTADKILIIDLDAHQGNGLERLFMHDPSIHFFDVYNQDIYPQDKNAEQKLVQIGNLAIPLHSQCSDTIYLGTLKEKFDEFMNAFIKDFGKPTLVFYNAGTDIYSKDPLGKMSVSQEGILMRDVYIFQKLIEHKFPFVMVPSGGYTDTSYLMIANSVSWLLQQND